MGPYLEVVLVIPGWGRGEDEPGILWVEVRGAAEHPQAQKSPQDRELSVHNVYQTLEGWPGGGPRGHRVQGLTCSLAQGSPSSRRRRLRAQGQVQGGGTGPFSS